MFGSGKTIHRSLSQPGVERLTVGGSWRRHVEDAPQAEVDERFRWRLDLAVREFLPEEMRPA